MAGDKHRNNGRAMVGLSPVTHRRLKVYHDQLVMWALEHPQLCLELEDVAAEAVERRADAVRLVAAAGAPGQLFERGQGGQ